MSLGSHCLIYATQGRLRMPVRFVHVCMQNVNMFVAHSLAESHVLSNQEYTKFLYCGDAAAKDTLTPTQTL